MGDFVQMLRDAPTDRSDISPHARRLLTVAADEIERLRAEVAGERDAREKSDRALREKGEAMGVLFQRLTAAGVDYSDLIS